MIRWKSIESFQNTAITTIYKEYKLVYYLTLKTIEMRDIQVEKVWTGPSRESAALFWEVMYQNKS